MNAVTATMPKGSAFPQRPQRLAIVAAAGTQVERSEYRNSRTSNAMALLASGGITALIIASFLFMNATHPQKVAANLNVFALQDMAAPPPEPAPAPPPPKPAEAAATVTRTPPLVPIPQAAPVPAPPIAAGPPASDAPIQQVSVPAGATGPSSPPHPVNGADLSTKLLAAKPPSYPVESRQLREQGTVILAVLLSPDGRVDQISIKQSSGFFRLDRAAMSAVRHWRWSPTLIDGQAVAVRGMLTIPFILRSSGQAAISST